MKYYSVSSKAKGWGSTYIGIKDKNLIKVITTELNNGAEVITIELSSDQINGDDVITIPRDQYEVL